MRKNHYSIVFHPLAEKEYFESITWYENELIGLSDDFINEIEKVVGGMLLQPKLYSIKRLKMREANVKRFPYVIVYKVLEKERKIFILSVFHTNRNPKFKKR